MEYNLAKLERITNLREVWNHEARDFTCWLAKEENLAMLSDVIGVPMELKERESSVGNFNVDLFAMVADTEPERKIIIENQLEDTNHDHLGKIITYASGKDAEILIWIVKRAREEHRQAVEWLNQHTDTNVSVFLIEIELWRIDNSRMAPKFNIVVKPNDWAKAMRSGENSSCQIFSMNFWDEFKNYAETDKSFHQLFSKLRKPSQQNTYDLPFRDAGLWVFLKYDTRKSLITCGIYIRKDKERYEYIKKHEDIIKRYFPEYKILFDEKQERQGTSITISKENSDVNNQNQRPSMFLWFCENAVKWKKVLDEIG